MSRRDGRGNAIGEDERKEQFDAIVEYLEEAGGEVAYDSINRDLGEKWEGIRLVLKAAKDAGLVDFDGVVPSFSGTIRLAGKSEE